MDDGSFTGSGLKLHTNAFTLEELNLLIDALNNFKNLLNFKNLFAKASINISKREKAQYTLYISKNQLQLVLDLVKDHMHEDMMYKLNIN